MNLGMINAREARALLDAISTCGVPAPEDQAGLLETLDAIRAAGTQESDPTDALIRDAFERKLRGAELRKRISQASAAFYDVEYGHGLPQRAERSAMHAFAKALEKSAATRLSPH